MNTSHARTQSCPTLCDPMDCSPPGSYMHGILQTTILEQVAISYSMGSSCARDQTCVSSHFLHWQQILYHCATWEDALKAAGVSSERETASGPTKPTTHLGPGHRASLASA